MAKTVTRSLKININGKEIDNSISQINKQINQLKKNLKAANNPGDRKKYNDQLKEAINHRKKINDELRESKGLLGKIKSSFGGTAAALGAVFAIDTLVGWGKQLYDNIQLMRELQHETKLLTGLQGEQLDSAVSKTKALADTFDTDYKSNLEAANALSKQFGVSYNEALTAIEKGYLAGADASGDMLNQLKEYGPLMKEANIPLEDMVALIAQTEKEGIFNDKGIDAVKEGMLAIREGTDATRDALTGLGLDTNKIYADLKAGNVSYFEVLQQVSGKLGELGDQSPEVGSAIADIFKGAGEDAGLDYLQSLKDIDLNLNGLIDTSDEYTQLKQEEVSINERLNDSWVKLSSTGGVFNKVMLTLKNIAADVLEGVSLLGKSFDELDKEAEARAKKNSLEQSKKDELKQYESYQKKIKELLGDQYDYAEQKERYLQGLYQSIRRAEESGRTQEVNQLKAAIDEITNYEINKEKEKKSKLASLRGGKDGKKGKSLRAQKEAAENKKIEAERARLLQKIQGLEEKALLAKKDIDQREIQQIVNKYDKLLAVAKEGSEEETKLLELRRNEIQAKELAQEEAFQQEKEKVRQKYNLLTNEEKKANELNALKAFYDQKLISETDYQIAKKAIIDSYKQAKEDEALEAKTKADENVENELQKILENESLTDQQRYEAQLARLDEFLANKEISEEEYEKRVSALKSQHTLLRFQQARQGFEALGNLISKAKNFELSQVKEVTKRKGESEESFLKRKEEVEKKKKEINKKYALVELLTTVGKTAASTALGIMQAYAQMGPIGGTIFAAIIGTIGALQIAQAKKEYDRVKSYAVGGFTHTGSYSGGVDGMGGQLSILHPDEYVIPKVVLQDREDPLVPQMVHYLEAKRQNRTYMDGGFSKSSTTTTATSNAASFGGDTVQMQQLLERLNYNLENPEPSRAVYDEEETERIKSIQQEKEQAREGAIIR